MAGKPEIEHPAPADVLQRELERLARLSRDFSEREYRALLEGVVLGQRAARQPARSPELQRMLEDFAAEIQKLDEGLRLLTAFLARLREKTALEPASTLH